jgi:large subunit ribosomal protein L46
MQVVTPEDLPFQKEYYEWQYKLMRKYRKELPKEFQESEAKKAENASTSGWQPAPRVTEADRSNDTKSLERKLDRRLFLMLKKKGAEYPQLPLFSFMISICMGQRLAH